MPDARTHPWEGAAVVRCGAWQLLTLSCRRGALLRFGSAARYGTVCHATQGARVVPEELGPLLPEQLMTRQSSPRLAGMRRCSALTAGARRARRASSTRRSSQSTPRRAAPPSARPRPCVRPPQLSAGRSTRHGCGVTTVSRRCRRLGSRVGCAVALEAAAARAWDRWCVRWPWRPPPRARGGPILRVNQSDLWV